MLQQRGHCGSDKPRTLVEPQPNLSGSKEASRGENLKEYLEVWRDGLWVEIRKKAGGTAYAKALRQLLPYWVTYQAILGFKKKV